MISITMKRCEFSRMFGHTVKMCFLVVIIILVTGCRSYPAALFESQWDRQADRIWADPEYWANPILNEPQKVTAKYEVLEPEMWEGIRLPILDQIDIANQLKEGDWVILLYHYDCPDCAKAIPEYEQMAYDLAGNGDFLRFAFVEIPPFGKGPIDENAPCISGRMSEDKQWLVTTPVVILMSDSKVLFAWEYDPPDLDAIFEKLMANDSFSTSASATN